MWAKIVRRDASAKYHKISTYIQRRFEHSFSTPGTGYWAAKGFDKGKLI